MTAQTLKTNKGFTLIELLVVIGILAILLAITLIAINPARQFGQANDTKRRSDVTAILNAIGQYGASNGGNLPGEIAALAAGTPDLLDSVGFPNLCDQLVDEYLPALPKDPSANDQDGITEAECGAAWTTDGPGANDGGYTVERDATNRITVAAETPFAGPIEVTR